MTILHSLIHNIQSQLLIPTFPIENNIIPTLPNAPKSKGKNKTPRGTQDMDLIISSNIKRQPIQQINMLEIIIRGRGPKLVPNVF